jgi:hypothetical protein
VSGFCFDLLRCYVMCVINVGSTGVDLLLQ